MTVTNEAVNGATLAPNITDNVNGGIRTCISTVVTSSTALAKADYILLEGGVNDAWNKAPVGTLTDGFAAAYDETTMTGALEKMLEYLAKNYSDKRVAYVFPHGGLFGSSENWYKTYKPAILAALQKVGRALRGHCRKHPAHGRPRHQRAERQVHRRWHTPQQSRLRAVLCRAHRCAAEAAVRKGREVR